MAKEFFGCRNSDCDNKRIAEIITFDGLQFLSLNNVLTRDFHGVCKCGQDIHFKTSDRALIGLYRRVSLKDMFQKPLPKN